MRETTAAGARLRPSARATTLGLVLLFIAGCGSDDIEDAVGDAVDSVDSAFLEGALLAANADPMGFDMTPDQAAQTAVMNASEVYEPAGCASATAEGATAITTLKGCRGPRGLAGMTGKIKVIYGVVPEGLQAHMTSKDLRINRASLDLNTVGIYSLDGERAVLDVTTNASGTGVIGRRIARKGSYRLIWDPSEPCVDIDGTWDTAGLRRWKTTVTGLRRCAGKCPSAGQITFRGGLDDVSITITFNGRAQASWTTSRGESGARDLTCTP